MERLAQVGVCALLSPCTCASTPTPTPQGIGRTEHGSVGEPAGIASGAGFPSLCRQGRTQGGSLHKPFGRLIPLPMLLKGQYSQDVYHA